MQSTIYLKGAFLKILHPRVCTAGGGGGLLLECRLGLDCVTRVAHQNDQQTGGDSAVEFDFIDFVEPWNAPPAVLLKVKEIKRH